MTASGAYPALQGDQGSGETRSAEPSMEDILASIRRIIADDQLHNPRPGTGPAVRAPAGPSNLAAKPVSPPLRQSDDEHAGSKPDDALDPEDIGQDPVAETAGDEPRGREPDPAEPVHRPAAAAASGVGPFPFAGPRNLPPPARVEASGSSPSSAAPASIERGQSLSPVSRGRFTDPLVMLVRQEAAPASDASPAAEPAAPPAEPAGGDHLLSPPLGASVMSAFETLAASVVLQNTPMLEGIMRDAIRPLLKTWLDDHLPALVERLVRAEIERVARGGRG